MPIWRLPQGREEYKREADKPRSLSGWPILKRTHLRFPIIQSPRGERLAFANSLALSVYGAVEEVSFVSQGDSLYPVGLSNLV